MGFCAGVPPGDGEGLHPGEPEPRGGASRRPHGLGDGGGVGLRRLRCVLRRASRIPRSSCSRAHRVHARTDLRRCGGTQYGDDCNGGAPHWRERPARRRTSRGPSNRRRNRDRGGLRHCGCHFRTAASRVDGCFAGDGGDGHHLHSGDVRRNGNHPLSARRPWSDADRHRELRRAHPYTRHIRKCRTRRLRDLHTRRHLRHSSVVGLEQRRRNAGGTELGGSKARAGGARGVVDRDVEHDVYGCGHGGVPALCTRDHSLLHHRP